MKHKVILKGIEARNKVLKGANFLADCVKLTLGPHGSNAISGIRGGSPHITNDGVSIAKEISSKDEIEDLGIRTLREAAMKTNDEAGDGTTTAITLAQAIVNEAVKSLPDGRVLVGKKTPPQIVKAIREETDEAISKLKEMATKVESEEELIAVAKVAVEDDNLAKLIGSAQWDLGKEGTLLAEETTEMKDSVEKVVGIRIDNGFGTSIAINNVEKQALEVENIAVIMSNHIFHGLTDILPFFDDPTSGFLKNTPGGKRQIILIGKGFDQIAIATCLANIEKGFAIYPVNAPFVNQKEIMKDMAAVLGGRYYDEEESDITKFRMTDLGFAEKVVARRWDATFTGKKDADAILRISERVKMLEEELKGEGSAFSKKAIETRISQLQNGFGIVKVGATSDAERKYKKDKVDDAVNAVKAALQEGVVPGAGQALRDIGEAMPDDYILKEPLRAPYKQIMANAGETFEVPEWVKDPVKVVRIALEKASSVAATLATTNIAINHQNEEPMYVQKALQSTDSGVE